MPVAGPIEEHITCFLVEPESQGGLLWLQGFLDGCLSGTETAVKGREKDFPHVHRIGKNEILTVTLLKFPEP